MKTDETLQNRSNQRPLAGRCIGISISESADLASFGFTVEAVNALTVDLARRLIALGATVALGHNWRTGGVMEAVARFALSFKDQSAAAEHPLILNYLAYPDIPSLSDADSRELATIVDIKFVRWQDQAISILETLRHSDSYKGLSNRQDVGSLLFAHADNIHNGDMRPLELTALRFVLAQCCDVLLVIGGRTTGYQGLAPGIIEEAWWSACLDKQVVVCTGMGGAATAMTDSDSQQAQEVYKDTAHELAGAYLRDLNTGRFSAQMAIASNLSAESILMHVTKRK